MGFDNHIKGKQDEAKAVARSRTACCGEGSYGVVYGIYLVMDPKAVAPTQTAERIGGFRGCSSCAKPLGPSEIKPGYNITSSLWLAMLARTKTHGSSAY